MRWTGQRMKKRLYILLTIGMFLFLAGCQPTTSTPTTSTPTVSSPTTSSPTTSSPTTSTPTTPTTPPGAAELVVENYAFNLYTIRVLAGEELSFVFENKDNDTHNFAVYDTRQNLEVIFRGEALSGPGFITYTFMVPDVPNIHYFRCDFHPLEENGIFIVGGTSS